MHVNKSAVSAFYDSIADSYETEFEAKSDYKVPKLLREEFVRHRFNTDPINADSILDVGCGTGKLKEYLENKFVMYGIDVSAQMISKARLRVYDNLYLGPAEEILSQLPSKSVDHIVALSSLYFIKDITSVVEEFIRIARKSIFVTLEFFDEETKAAMRAHAIEIYNHRWDEHLSSIGRHHLWTRPSNKKEIRGHIIHKIL
jgi:ubiquinone/menaquinone biosynthesis C-methylase UbiE